MKNSILLLLLVLGLSACTSNSDSNLSNATKSTHDETVPWWVDAKYLRSQCETIHVGGYVQSISTALRTPGTNGCGDSLVHASSTYW